MAMAPSRLVIELMDDLAGTRLAHLFAPVCAGALRGVVERLTDIAQRTGERLGHLARRLVAQIADVPLGFVQQPILAPLQSLVPARIFASWPLGLVADRAKLLVAVLDRSLGGASADEDDLLPIGGGDEGVHAQVHADNRSAEDRFASGISQMRRTRP